MALPSKDSTPIRALRVFIFTMLPMLAYTLADPTVMQAITDYAPALIPSVVIGASVCAAAYHYFSKNTPNW